MSTNPDKAHLTRIAIYVHTLYNGGVERVMFNLIQRFLDRGFAVDLVVDILVFSPFESLIPTGTVLVKLEAHRFVQRLPRLTAYIRRRKPAALLAATHFANEIACLARMLARIPTLITITEHTNLYSDIADSKSFLRRRLLPWTTRRIYPLADSIVAVSNGVADNMCRVSGLGRQLVKTIYNPIDFATLRELANGSIDHDFFRSGEPPVVLAIGRLEVQKDFPNLIRAFAKLRQKHNVSLLILGEGGERKRLSSLVAELDLVRWVSMPGFVKNPAAYMSKAKLFAMSSSWEGMPVSLIEALALGLPVVSTDCPSGPAEILDGGRFGELVPMNDSGALADAMARGLSGRGQPPVGDWLKQFDVDEITDKYLGLMLERLPSKRHA